MKPPPSYTFIEKQTPFPFQPPTHAVKRHPPFFSTHRAPYAPSRGHAHGSCNRSCRRCPGAPRDENLERSTWILKNLLGSPKTKFRYLKWRVSWTLYKAVVGGGETPLHKPYPYSLYRFEYLHFRYCTWNVCGDRMSLLGSEDQRLGSGGYNSNIYPHLKVGYKRNY